MRLLSRLLLLASLVPLTAQSEITYVHTDILGSPIMETNEQGDVISRTHYKPFGETLETPKNDVGYTGHLNDTDLALTYMQARYYDPLVGRFYSNDPVGYSIENPVMSFNRYLYVNNNPYKYNDPDGRKLRFAAGSTPKFKKQFGQIIKYHNKAGTAAPFARLEKLSAIVTIAEGSGHQFEYDFNSNTITFDPTSGLEVSPGNVQTPALGVLHEAAHAESDLTNPTQHLTDTTTPDVNFGSVEEKDVIEKVETPAAKKLGEPTRSSHGGRPVRVTCPTCDK